MALAELRLLSSPQRSETEALSGRLYLKGKRRREDVQLKEVERVCNGNFSKANALRKWRLGEEDRLKFSQAGGTLRMPWSMWCQDCTVPQAKANSYISRHRSTLCLLLLFTAEGPAATITIIFLTLFFRVGVVNAYAVTGQCVMKYQNNDDFDSEFLFFPP